jgi:hypothetical protein
MRRTIAVVACLVAILGIVPAAFAQAPAPKVTIVGLFDQVTSAGANIYDGNFSRSSEREWYARTRFRPDFTFEVGRTKAVLGLEIDMQYGQGGRNDGGFPGNTTGTNVGQKGDAAGLDINTDVAGRIEIKWIYTEFDLTGKDSLLPFIPVPTVARLGGQPFATLGNYRVTYANGDFAGISAVTTWAPNLKTNVAYVQVEEEIAGANRLQRTALDGRRGNDFAVIISPEITPFKGLDIKPLYSYFYAEGTTSGSARRPIANQTQPGETAASSAVNPGEENRHTIGIDARWRSGPFSLDPTVYFQFGDRTQRDAGHPAGTIDALMRSWLIDIQGGFQLGPLLLEARGIWSTGNKAKDDLRQKVNYFEPLDLDTSYYAGWANILALGPDYFNGGQGAVQSFDTHIGYDRYGRRQFGVRATYSLTPELSFYGVVSPTWSDQKVDTDTTIVAGGNNRTAPLIATRGGESRYIGTEVDLGTTWRFAPNVVFDLVGAYLFAGSALDTTEFGVKGLPATTGVHRDSQDGWTVAARMRLSF